MANLPHRVCHRCGVRISSNTRFVSRETKRAFCGACYRTVVKPLPSQTRSQLWVGNFERAMRSLARDAPLYAQPYHVVVRRNAKLWCLTCQQFEAAPPDE